MKACRRSVGADGVRPGFPYPYCSQGRTQCAPTLLFILMILAQVTPAWAHESRPAYLEIKETAPNRYDVLWRTPVLSGMRLPVELRLPDDVRNVKEPIVVELPGSLVERRVIDAGSNGLAGRRIEFAGLIATITDVLVRVQQLNGEYSTTLVHPSKPWIVIAPSRGKWSIAFTYLRHGVDHILLGVDPAKIHIGAGLSECKSESASRRDGSAVKKSSRV